MFRLVVDSSFRMSIEAAAQQSSDGSYIKQLSTINIFCVSISIVLIKRLGVRSKFVNYLN